MWGVVWDAMPGVFESDADSFWVSVDDEDPEWRWVYGCETAGAEELWTYQRFSSNPVPMGCGVEEVSWDLSAGEHTLRLRNREASDSYGAASVARVLITSDFNHVPILVL
jgi:hypothetical protein